MSDLTSVPTDGLRRLPWNAESGVPAYLSTDDPNGFLSTVADSVEEALILDARNVEKLARTLVNSDHRLSPGELQHTLTRALEALSEALSVATMRGERLGIED